LRSIEARITADFAIIIVLDRQRMAAGATRPKARGGSEPVRDGHAIVENIALAVEQRLLTGDAVQVGQDPALQVVNFWHVDHRGSFFASSTTLGKQLILVPAQ
jgi:hypothetical protein